MFKQLMRFAGVPVLALSLVLWGCENAGQLTGPGELNREESGEGFTVVRENNASTGVVSGTIDQNGGKLILGKHSLEVPAGAVDAPTVFTMTKLDAPLTFELTATRVTTNDIGAQGFSQAVVLNMDYKDAQTLPSDQKSLRVFWKKLDGTYEAQESSVDVVGKRLKGKLWHFSEYAGGW